jgi:hypothetical protein
MLMSMLLKSKRGYQQ